MRFWIFSLLLLVPAGSDGSFRLQKSAGSTLARSTSPTGALEVTTSIVEAKYCSDECMLLILQPTYRNIGETNLILFKYALPPFEHRISKNKNAARVKDYEQVITPMMGSSPSLIEFGDEPPSAYFMVLKPGESYTTVNTITVPIFIADADKETGKDKLRKGEHVLELIVPTWPVDRNRVAKVQSLWQRFGSLWTDPIMSLPMVFKVESLLDRPLSDCNGASKTKGTAIP
jgi:hypothetical protein